ncbi:MAG: hypothetical protein FD124_1620 [Alphaproteobacteria bacterium]|nr:MAG: hypothetical protein FD160_1508 [Caulobacteraceae bacterium]TPW06620.1 MAG: hypothetical protein FD124_1620 [Alphaproteobacteria bacterium]
MSDRPDETRRDAPASDDIPSLEIVGVSPGITVDHAGARITFAVTTAAGGVRSFSASSQVLGVLINTLQLAARTAHQRRVAADPSRAFRDPRVRRADPVRQIEMEMDAAGRAALWRFTGHDGASHEAQISLELLEGLVEKLPRTIAELKRLRADKAAPN